MVLFNRGAPNGDGYQTAAPPPQNPEDRNLKNTGFVGIISNVLRKFHLSRNQLLKSVYD
jgi:hypothetical protein